MKKFTLLFMLIILNLNLASAHSDLSDYPDILAESGKLKAVMVVGDKSASSNVLAQISIGSSLRDYKSDAEISNKLSSEILDINQNIISIGNPCINPVSASVMGNPIPCDKDFPKGKAYIRLFTKGDFHHIVVAGYSDFGTRIAADILANYKKYDFQGDEFEIEAESQNEEAAIGAGEKQEEKLEAETNNNKIIAIDTKQNATIRLENEGGEGQQSEPSEETSGDSKSPEPEINDDLAKAKRGSFISKFFKWIFNLFG